MSTLIAVAYPEEGRAAEVLNTLRKLQAEYLIDLDDAVVVTKNQNGKLKLHQSVNLTAAGAAEGAFWGFLIGMVFTLPFPFIAPAAWLGMPALTAGVGAAAGAIGGHFSDYGIDDQFVKDLSASMQPNSSALFVLIRRSHCVSATPCKPADSDYMFWSRSAAIERGTIDYRGTATV